MLHLSMFYELDNLPKKMAGTALHLACIPPFWVAKVLKAAFSFAALYVRGLVKGSRLAKSAG